MLFDDLSVIVIKDRELFIFITIYEMEPAVMEDIIFEEKT